MSSSSSGGENRNIKNKKKTGIRFGITKAQQEAFYNRAENFWTVNTKCPNARSVSVKRMNPHRKTKNGLNLFLTERTFVRAASYPVPAVAPCRSPLGLLQPPVREGVFVEAVGAKRAGAPTLVEVTTGFSPEEQRRTGPSAEDSDYYRYR